MEIQNWLVSGELVICPNKLYNITEMLQWTVLQSGISHISMCPNDIEQPADSLILKQLAFQ